MSPEPGTAVAPTAVAPTAVAPTDVAALDEEFSAAVLTVEPPARVVRPADRAGALWSSLWPKLAAVLIALALWEAVVLAGWKPTFVLPGPIPVLKDLAAQLVTAST